MLTKRSADKVFQKVLKHYETLCAMIGRFKNGRKVLTDGLPNKATNQALVMNEAPVKL